MCQDLQEEPRLIGQNVVKSICRISLLKSLQPPWWIFFVGKSDRLRSTICICVFKRLKERFLLVLSIRCFPWIRSVWDRFVCKHRLQRSLVHCFEQKERKGRKGQQKKEDKGQREQAAIPGFGPHPDLAQSLSQKKKERKEREEEKKIKNRRTNIRRRRRRRTRRIRRIESNMKGKHAETGSRRTWCDYSFWLYLFIQGKFNSTETN